MQNIIGMKPRGRMMLNSSFSRAASLFAGNNSSTCHTRSYLRLDCRLEGGQCRCSMENARLRGSSRRLRLAVFTVLVIHFLISWSSAFSCLTTSSSFSRSQSLASPSHPVVPLSNSLHPPAPLRWHCEPRHRHPASQYSHTRNSSGPPHPQPLVNMNIVTSNYSINTQLSS